MTRTTVGQQIAKKAEEITGKRYCAGHNRHIAIEKFAKHKNYRKCDVCVEKGRTFDELKRQRQ